MEENKKNTIKRALIITIILVLLLVLTGFLIFKNRDAFGIKTSATISKIFSPLTTSTNSKDLKKINAQAGEDIKKGDNVSVFGTASNSDPIVMRTSTNGGSIYGYANEDINNGNSGEIILSTTNENGFWNSFSGFMGGLFNYNGNNGDNTDGSTDGNTDNICTNGTDNFPLCTTVNGQCQNGADNPPLCTTIDNICMNGAINPPECNSNGTTCTNGTDNFPMCTTIDGQCPGGEVNPPECSNNGEECTNGTDNYPLCTTKDGECPGGQIDPPTCMDDGKCALPNIIDTDNGQCIDPLQCLTPKIISGNKCINPSNLLPDLTVIGNISPISTSVNTPTTFSANIMNIGGGSTEHSFSTIFSLNTLNRVGSDRAIVVPTLASGVSTLVTTSINFDLLQDFSIRVCVDKNSTADAGTVAESNENNNCGPYTIIKVSNSLPGPEELPVCSDTIDNDKDNLIDQGDPNCHLGGLMSGTYMPDHTSESTSPIDPTPGNKECSDNVDNDDTDNLADELDPECSKDGVYNKDWTSESEGEITPDENMCLLIDQHPLTFTAQEKAELASLLRKFYLLASTLKSEDDIKLAYSEIAQYRNFSDHLAVLTNQCYTQISDPNYTGEKTQWGNPWYKNDTKRGTYTTPEMITLESVAALECIMYKNQHPDASDRVCPDFDTSIIEKILNVW